MEKSALVLVEFQREWLDAQGKIHPLMEDQEQLTMAISHAEEVLKAARSGKLEIIHVGLAFSEGHKELGKAAFGLREAIAKFGTFPANGKGSEFQPPFTPQAGEFVARGRSGVSGFSGSNLDNYLRNNRINRIYLMGFALHVCVDSTLRDGHDRGYDVILIEDACSAFNQAQREHVLEQVVHHYGGRVTAGQFIQELEAGRIGSHG